MRSEKADTLSLPRFLQIGQDPDATAFLRELDDDLKARHGVRDIVDTVEHRGTLSSDFIMSVSDSDAGDRSLTLEADHWPYTPQTSLSRSHQQADRCAIALMVGR